MNIEPEVVIFILVSIGMLASFLFGYSAGYYEANKQKEKQK